MMDDFLRPVTTKVPRKLTPKRKTDTEISNPRKRYCTSVRPNNMNESDYWIAE